MASHVHRHAHAPFAGAIRAGVVGAGNMGRWHALGARRLGAKIVAIVDPSPESARALAASVGGAPVFRDVGAMLAAAHPNVVHICTPLRTHVPLALEAIEARVHALVEKPLAFTAEETAELLDYAREHAVHVCPVHQYAFQEGVVAAMRALPRLGRPLHATFTLQSAAASDRVTMAALDGIVGELLPHPFSVLQALWRATPLRAAEWRARTPGHGELAIRGRAGDATVAIDVSAQARPPRADVEILCSGGSIALNLLHGFVVIRRGEPSPIDDALHPFVVASKTLGVAAANLVRRTWSRQWGYPGLEPLIARFYAAALGRTDNPIPAPQVLAVAAMRQHVLRAAMPWMLPDFGDAGERPADRQASHEAPG
jgi:predicted dehydrogenase